MLFPSFAFLVFLPLVFLLYWYAFNRNLRLQNAFLLIASYVFYGWWDWRFLGLLFASSLGDFLLALAIDRSSGRRAKKRWLIFSLIINLGVLATFKYFNFFRDGFVEVLQAVGMKPDIPTLHVLLPVGISFYTFQSLSYTIDVYRGQIKASRDPVAFLAFVSFFPQLAAGPIERAQNLLGQFLRPRAFNMDAARDGLRQLLWGLFKKVAIADTCAPIVNNIYGMDPAETSGVTLFFGAFFFAFQIYGDFSGYSDMAIGMARLFGFGLSRNFAYPHFSRSIGEFWRRWHITLSTWFRDYIYIPLGGSRKKQTHLRNILITFAVSGLWHGANWTFVSWGVLHGLMHIPTVIKGHSVPKEDARLRDLPAMTTTFLLVAIALVLFRSQNMHDAMEYIGYMVLHAAWNPGAVLLYVWRPEMLLVAALLVLEWNARHLQHPLEHLPFKTPLRWICYLILILIVLVQTDLRNAHEFIYFQF